MQGRGTVLVITPEPRAGLVRVVRAQRRYGSSRRRAVRFVALHLLLGPLAVLCGVSPAGRLDWMGAEGESLEGVYRLILRDGQSESVPR
jgi:hypothetical protein